MSDTRIGQPVGSTTRAGAPAPSDRNSLTIGDDFGQPGILVRKVFNDAQRAKLVDQVAGVSSGACASPCSVGQSNIGLPSTRTPAGESSRKFAPAPPRSRQKAWANVERPT